MIKPLISIEERKVLRMHPSTFWAARIQLYLASKLFAREFKKVFSTK